jgi:hypothetical protein
VEDAAQQHQCPNCGAAVDRSAVSRCPSCASILRSAAHDWVLAEVSDRVDWVPADERAVPGMDVFRREDPSFSRQHLEDRVGVVFWRLALAEHERSARRLRRVVAPDALERLEVELTGAASQHWSERTIGAITTIGLIPHSEGDRAVVEVRWIAARDAPDRERPGAIISERSPRRHLFVLGRRSGARTSIDFALASAHCAACGAPEQGSDWACHFCGAAASEDWTLVGRFVRHEAEAVRWLEAARNAAAAAGPEWLSPDTAAAITVWTFRHLQGLAEDDALTDKLLERLAASTDFPWRALVADETIADGAGAAPVDRDEAERWLGWVAETLIATSGSGPAEEALIRSLAKEGAAIEFYPARRLFRAIERRTGNATTRDGPRPEAARSPSRSST